MELEEVKKIEQSGGLEIVPEAVDETIEKEKFENLDENDDLFSLLRRNKSALDRLGNPPKRGQTSVGSTGLQSITGIGFKPSFIVIRAYKSGNNGSWCYGTTDGTTDYYTTHYYTGSAWVTTQGGSILVNILNTLGNTDSSCIISSLDNDGFTLNWQNVTGTVYYSYECY